MRGKWWIAACLSVLGSAAQAQTQQDLDLAFMEGCQPERSCVCDSLDGWFACVADAARLSGRPGFAPDVLVASIVSEADRHLARDCANGGGPLHRMCEAAVQLREVASAEDPVQAFLDTEFSEEPLPDALNDEWRAFLNGELPEEFPLAAPGQPGGGAGGARVPAADATRRGGSSASAGLTAHTATEMCEKLPPANESGTWANCRPAACQGCPSSPAVTLELGGQTMVLNAEQICRTKAYGLGDLLKNGWRPVGNARLAMSNLLAITVGVLDAVARHAGPILCGYARNQVYLSADCIDNFGEESCAGARLALNCLGCGNSGARLCNEQCLCFWQALASYGEDRLRRENWWCRNFGIRCPDDRGYFYRLGTSCLKPPPGGLRNGGYR